MELDVRVFEKMKDEQDIVIKFSSDVTSESDSFKTVFLDSVVK